MATLQGTVFADIMRPHLQKCLRKSANGAGKALTSFEGFFQGSPGKQGAFDADGVLANYAEGVEFAQRGVFPVSLASPVAQEGPEAAGEVCYLGDVLTFYGL